MRCLCKPLINRGWSTHQGLQQHSKPAPRRAPVGRRRHRRQSVAADPAFEQALLAADGEALSEMGGTTGQGWVSLTILQRSCSSPQCQSSLFFNYCTPITCLATHHCRGVSLRAIEPVSFKSAACGRDRDVSAWKFQPTKPCRFPDKHIGRPLFRSSTAPQRDGGEMTKEEFRRSS